MKFCKIVEIRAAQNCENLVDLEKFCKMTIWLPKSALIRPRTSIGKSDVSWQWIQICLVRRSGRPPEQRCSARRRSESRSPRRSPGDGRPDHRSLKHQSLALGVQSTDSPSRGSSGGSFSAVSYQRRSWQPNNHFAAFFEIYKIFNFYIRFSQFCAARTSKFYKISSKIS